MKKLLFGSVAFVALIAASAAARRTWICRRRRRGVRLDPRWSIKTEALYVDLGKNSATITGTAQSTPPGNPTIATASIYRTTMWIVRAGVNYKFGG
ncbi:MAG: hypothetical protein WAV38_28240 [Xanthobacteraceae bacterium]